MAAKRLHEDGNQSQDDDQAKRLKKQISFSSVIRKAILFKTLQNITLELEPLLRRVVKEEVEQGLVHVAVALQRSPPQRQIQVTEPSNLKLIFKKPPSLPIYTSTKIDGEDGQCLQIQLIDTLTGETPAGCRLLSNLKVELVAINGDFPGDREEWSPSEFTNNIVRERQGRRPLLVGSEVSVLTLRDGVVSIGDLIFTDNSSWTRSRHFRIGARVVPESYDGPRIIEALTERFTVKDQRVYKKHYPPALGDEVWRLERIGKGGTFHSKLAAEKIETVQDFLKLLVIDPNHLRSILGSMSDKMWLGTISHARTCPLGTKHYLFDHEPDCAIILNPICEVVSVLLNGNLCRPDQLHAQQRAYVQWMAKEAYLNWSTVKETDCFLAANTLLPMEPAPQGPIPSSSWHPANQEITASDEFQVLEGSPDESQLFEAVFSFDPLFGSKTQPH